MTAQSAETPAQLDALAAEARAQAQAAHETPTASANMATNVAEQVGVEDQGRALALVVSLAAYSRTRLARTEQAAAMIDGPTVVKRGYAVGDRIEQLRDPSYVAA